MCSSALESISTDEIDGLAINAKQVKNVFKNVTINKTTGPDGISTFGLKKDVQRN